MDKITTKPLSIPGDTRQSTSRRSYEISEKVHSYFLLLQELIGRKKDVALTSWSFSLVTLVSSSVFFVLLALPFVVAFPDFLKLGEQTYIFAVDVFIVALIVAASLVIGYNVAASTYFSASNSGYNDNATSIFYSLKVIHKAREWVLFYDFGEAQAGNIYHSPEVARALIKKLTSKQRFELSLIFRNKEDEVNQLPLVRDLRGWQAANPKEQDRVLIVYDIDRTKDDYEKFNGECADFPYHYKINERAYAYLTQHEGEAGTTQRRLYRYSTPWAGWPLARVQDSLDFHNAVLSSQDT